MLVLLASRHDDTARALAARWAADGVALLTPRELSVAGWRHHLGSPSESAAVVDGRPVPVEELTGVLTRLWCVGVQDLPHIVPADREYVSIEMSAFLTSWLSSLKCPVLNRPTAGCLAGPNWQPEEWAHRAARLGIPVKPIERRSALGMEPAPPPAVKEHVKVTVVGGRCLGAKDETLRRHARRLAEHAGTGLLDVLFDGDDARAFFVGVSLWPDIGSPEIADAIFEHLKGGVAC
ncbi:MAG TPA: hypothetical protein VKB12_08970 [Pyrinomonadaceae bacterium]|nr:hypothetical protein [Pyrinomonadaceae bacterium]